MAELGPGPHASAKVAATLGKARTQLGPVHDSLIKRGLCYAPRWGLIAFTVPMFDGFLRRWVAAPLPSNPGPRTSHPHARSTPSAACR